MLSRRPLRIWTYKQSSDGRNITYLTSRCQYDYCYLARTQLHARLALVRHSGRRQLPSFSVPAAHNTPRSYIHNTSTSLNRVAVVTGAARGIGRAIALQLARDGYDVALNDLVPSSSSSRASSSSSSLEEVREIIEGEIGRKTAVLRGDVSVEEDVKALVDGAVEKLGGVDVMVANAGIASPSAMLDISAKEWDRVMAINGRGVFLCYKYAAIQMIKQGRGGRIVGASSVAGKTGVPFFAHYSASKFAVSSLTQTAAQEWAKYSINVNAYAPGPIDTDLTREAATFAEINPDYNKDVPASASATAVGFIGTPEDVAGVVSYLVSDRARFMTGQVLGKLDGKCRPNSFQSTHTAAAYSTLRNLPSLHRVAVVTGAGKGIGRAVALQLAHDGYDIAVNDIHSMASSVNELCKTIREEMGRKAVALTGDVSLDIDVRRVVDGAVDVLGSVDVVSRRSNGFLNLVSSLKPIPRWSQTLG
ncbi:Short-chain dehydrogenase [Psilocybe cubensis]|uniref:Short-chain dehydrogenase n=1 Tax=Psilocybe cubensis TaxID=181762 RepID=A0ACB8GUI8_PSICU|nr:Short-chain dehydrogenase [Psilocybe cubensis]KAH9479102.1 Short-chain dehydrogenase [Psilocybe cubensis]